jgi:hypothetical protein
MDNENSTNFKNVEYRLIDEFNQETEAQQEQNINLEIESTRGPDKIPEDIDTTLYHTALQTKEESENLNFNSRNKSTKKNKNKNPLLNATMYSRRKNDDNDNKFVNASTLNSYLSISDLKLESEDNVNILKSNISKLDNRGDLIEEMEEKSQSLMDSSLKFKKRSNLLKNKMFWANVANILIIAFFIFLIVFLIIKLT